jgi:hypothetical protein
VRAQHDEILGCNDPADPGLAGVLTSQQAAQARVITDTESRVRSLEAFADRAEEADSVLSREKTARKIADLNDSYLDLLAQSSDRDFLDMTIGMTEELAVVIEQAKAAIREVTEAARLTLPVPRTPQDNH